MLQSTTLQRRLAPLPAGRLVKPCRPHRTCPRKSSSPQALPNGFQFGTILQSIPLPDPATSLGLLALGVVATAVVIGSRSMAGLYPALSKAETAPTEAVQPAPPKRENAVLVMGSTGKMGRALVKQLLTEGRTVVAAVRSKERGEEVLGQLAENFNKGSQLEVVEGVDVTQKSSLTSPELWRGVSQVAIAVGPLFGSGGYVDNMTSERVDFEGVTNIVEAATSNLPSSSGRTEETVLPLQGEQDVGAWERVDDVIMGGQSSSAISLAEDGRGALWSGELVMEGGGFCGTRAKGLNLDLSAYDGIALRLKGDGQMYKINLKTEERGDNPESTYAATFETQDGDWQTIHIPWREFVGVTRAKFDPSAPPLNPAKIHQIGFRLSRFDFNNLANPHYRPGPFSLQIDGGIQGYKESKPSLVLVSSSAVERNAIIGDDAEARKKDIPIVQLNPGGILNYKYMGENAVRGSGLPYSVIRPVGLTTENVEESFLMEAFQGDTISGKISREEAASVVTAALQSPASAGKTIEVRRREAASDKGKKSSARDLERLFLGAVEDWRRPTMGLPPMPMAVPPPPPPSKERVNEILELPAVKAVAARSRDAGHEEGSGKASSNGVTADREALTAAR